MRRVPTYRCSLVREGTTTADGALLDAQAVAAYGRTLIPTDDPRERFIAILLDRKLRPIGTTLVSLGTLTESLVHPREAFRAAIVAGAASIAFVHNHPSGDPTPSPQDRKTTARLVMAGELLGIPVVDHVVVAEAGYASCKDPAR